MKNLMLIVMLMVSPTLVAPTSHNLISEQPIKEVVVVVKNMNLFLQDLGHQES